MIRYWNHPGKFGMYGAYIVYAPKSVFQSVVPEPALSLGSLIEMQILGTSFQSETLG